MRKAIHGSLFALTVALAGAGCRGQNAPTPVSPPPQSPIPVSVKVTRVDVSGPDSVPPGGTLQLSATALLSDGTTREITKEASWQTDRGDLLSISKTGLVTAGANRGEAQVLAKYTGHPAAWRNAEVGSRTLLVLPAGTYRLTGVVKDGGAPVEGALVAITGGTATGTSVVTERGAFRFYGVSGETEIRVTKDGYDTTVHRVIVTNHQTTEVEIVPSRPRAIVAGTYTLTLAAAPECRANLPEVARERTYSAVITQSGAALTVTISGGKKVEIGAFDPTNTFSGAVEPDRLVFFLNDYSGPSPSQFYSPSILEEFSPTSLTVYGSASARANDHGYAGTLDGAFETLFVRGYWDYGADYERIAACRSASHQFILKR